MTPEEITAERVAIRLGISRCANRKDSARGHGRRCMRLDGHDGDHVMWNKLGKIYPGWGTWKETA